MSDLLLKPGSEIKIQRYTFSFGVQIVLGQRLPFDITKNLDEGVEFETENTRSNMSASGLLKLTAIYIDDVEVFTGELDANDIFTGMIAEDRSIPISSEATKILRGHRAKKSIRIVGEYSGFALYSLKIGGEYTIVISMVGPGSFKS